ncbi:MAG: HlyD family efflux transporter periplasmic adaptor subunit [Neomegalonema sp.]|nr:HlyD family efflux transporter periplasmic adaptor subunit [Neomegalonema sp.]
MSNKLMLLLAALAAVIAGVAFFWDAGDGVPDDLAYGNGRIEAVSVDIATKIPGRVEAVSAREGELIEAQAEMARIDDAQLQAQLLRAEAEIASAQSQVAAAEAAVAQAQAQLVLSQRELERADKLVAQGHASAEEHDIRQSNFEVAKANLSAAQAGQRSQERGVDAARAGAEEIRTQIADCVLRAPSFGRVLYRLAEPGEVLGAGGKVLTLLDLSDIYMELFLPAAQAHRIELGAEARVKLDIVDVAIPARVSFVSPESQFTPKQVETPSERDKLMFRVKVRVPSELVRAHIDRVKTGIRGVAYIRMKSESPSEWPEFLRKLPPDYVPEDQPKPTPSASPAQ